MTYNEIGNKGYIEVVTPAGASKTYGQVLNELHALLDISKVNSRTTHFVFASYLYPLVNVSNTTLMFTAAYTGATRYYIETQICAPNNTSTWRTALADSGKVANITDYTNATVGAARTFRIYY